MVRRDYTQRYQNATDALKALQGYINIYQTSTVRFRPPEQTTLTIPPLESFPNYSSSANETSLFQRIFQFFRQLFSESEAGNSQEPNIIEQPEGQVCLQSAFYVERQPMEADCYEAILQPGSLIRIKAPRQMGKTSLLTRILHHGAQHNCQTAYINFQLADVDFFTNLDKFLQWFCGSVAQALNLKDRLSEYWQGFLVNKDKCTNYFQRYLLSEISSPIIIGLDDVDRLFQYPQVSSEFFALLRAWHETSKNKEIWKKLRLVIVHCQEVYIPLNINQSPFNVGLPIALPEFSFSQVEYLVQQHRLKWTWEEIQQFMVMLGGHPYLVRKGLYEIARGRTTLSQLLRIAPTEQGFYCDHLRRHLSTLQEDSQLASAMKEVALATGAVRVDSALAFKLRSMGLVKFQENNIIPSCELYRKYFRERLN
ncbi:MAG: AAA-like domain-containing protein [Aetokthonos hydrillicola CCALA 1050]|nr:AAA-like domain-containing protein [Aetokthonos hydrillicola CCALA 1050]